MEGTAHCNGCGREVAIRRTRPLHLLHLILSIASRGLWLPVWAFLAFGWHGWKCTGCGGRIPWRAQKTVEAADPAEKSRVIRHFEWYRTLEPWGFTWLITLEGLFVGGCVAAALSVFAFPSRRDFGDYSLEKLFLLVVIAGPLLETLIFQAFPVLVARLCRAGFLAQVLAGSVFFALGHFLEGFAVGIAAGVVGGFYFAFTYVHWCSRSFWTALWTTTISHAMHNLIALSILEFARSH